MNVIDWLLDSDPAIRWQVMRDLTHEPADVVAAERARIATEGWGARLLALQAPDGRWGGAPWSQDYTDTFHVLELSAPLRTRSRERAGAAGDRSRPRARHVARWRRVRDPVVRQRVLRGRGRAVHQRQRRRHRGVLRRRHDAARRAAARSSSSPTAAGTARSRTARRCRHSARRSTCSRACSSTSGPSAVGQGRGGPPPRRGVHARAAPVPSQVDGRGDRPRLAPVLVPALVALRRPARARLPARRRRRARRARRGGDRSRRGNRDPDGRWPLQNVHPGESHVEMEDAEGQPSRWNTLRAMRVLDWSGHGE